MAEYCVQVDALDKHTEQRGTFIAQANTLRRVSPMFDGLWELFPWMRANGWEMAEHPGGRFVPWRVAKSDGVVA